MTTDAYLSATVPSSICLDSVGIIITLTKAMDVDLVFTVTSSEPTDSISIGPMAKGLTSWGFLLTTGAPCGPRTITIACDNPDVVIKINHVTFTALCTCPTDSGDTDQSTTFARAVLNCAGHLFQFSRNPATVAERDLYGDSPVSVLITE